MQPSEYQQRIVDYYRTTEHAYKDSWDLDNSLAIHYGYWDETVNSFRQSLSRMNEVMALAVRISSADTVLDAGCGVGGSSIFLASTIGCQVKGISLSERQVEQARLNAEKNKVKGKTVFSVMDYCHTSFADESFDVVWGCESICYAEDKTQFMREAWRLLKPGGRLVVADGFVTDIKNNKNPVIKNWLDGWQVNYLESPSGFHKSMKEQGFTNINYSDISKQTLRSSQRLYRFYFLASLYLAWKKINFSQPATDMQKANIRACKYQYIGMKRRLWQYGLFTGQKPPMPV
jgi:SAM-dependent methyltransferase